jgi:flagellar hook assembly protein FlgD
MKQFLLKTLVTLMLLSGAISITIAGTYGSGLRISNADSTAFDGIIYDTTGARLWFTLNGHADTVKVWINSGATKARSFAPMLNVAPGIYNVLWDGKDDGGNLMPTGRYNFFVESSDTGTTSVTWDTAWQNTVYGSGLSNRDGDIVVDPTHPWFGNIIMAENATGKPRILMAHANGDFKGAFATQIYGTTATGSDPFYVTVARNGDLYVANNTFKNIFVFRDTMLVQTINDTVIGFPRGIATIGAVNPTLLIATGNRILRRTSAGVIDTVFADTAAAGYVRDIIVDDSGYVYASFGATSTTYSKVVRLSRSNLKEPLDTLVLPERVTHFALFHGTNMNSNADDVLYARVLGANGGVFKLDFAAKSFTKLFTPSTSTSANHSISVDIVGNIYYENASNEWVRMYIPPTSAPAKFLSNKEINVGTIGTKIFDNFNATTGRFNQHPTFSGSTVGIDAASTAAWTSKYSKTGFGGSVEIKLIDNAAVTTPWQCRFLSGTGSIGNNVAFPPHGWIGYWMKTNNAPPGATVAIGVDDPSDPATKRSVQLPVINDGEWHLYQWNVEDPWHWTPWVVTSGSSKIVGPNAYIDAVWFLAPDGSAPWTILLDDVSHNPFGKISVEAGRGDITGNATVSPLDASWVLQHTVETRLLSDMQIFLADVNLSHEGLVADAVDASVMLAHVVGKVPYLPWTQALPPLSNVNTEIPAPLSIIIASVQGTAGKKVSIPVSVPTDLVGLRSAQMNIAYDASKLKVLSVSTTSLTKNFALESNIKNGTVLIAMAGGEEIVQGGQILMLEAEVLQSSENIGFTVDRILLNGRSVSKVTSVGGGQPEIPNTFALMQNYPNPFNPSTTIEFQLPANGNVELKVYDVAGREVATLVNEMRNAGNHRIVWNAVDNQGVKVSSGVYFYRISAGQFNQIKKMVLLK